MREQVETINLSKEYYLVVDHRDNIKYLMGYNHQVYPFHYVNRLDTYQKLIGERPEIVEYSVPRSYQ